jgi:hypothetical protein
MEVRFTEKGHIYTINGEIASISVTELLSKHGIAPDYSNVDKAKLKESAKQGKQVHKDLENILNKANYEPTTEQGKNFKKWVEKNLDCGVGEQMLGYEYKGLLIAGTADIMGILKNGALTISDHKNTSNVNKEYVTWQVSLLDYFARKLGEEKINGKLLKWKGATKFFCFHYDKDNGDMKVVELDKIDDSEIERLIEREYKNEKYQRKQLVIAKELQEKFLKAEETCFCLEQQYEQMKKTREELRKQIKELFEKQKIKSWESPNKKVLITYVPPVDRLGVDSTKLKREFPQVFDKCQKITKVNSQLRVKVRGEEDE